MINLIPYAAPCVRACALRSTLLRAEEWRTLAATDSSAAAIAWLQRRGVLPATVSHVIGAERAAHETVIHDSTALLRFARGDLAELLRFFVATYDLLNLESLIYRIHAMPEADQERTTYYQTGSAGALRRGLRGVSNYAALARAVKGTLFGGSFNMALQRYHDDEDVAQLVEKVELGFFTLWVQAADRCGFHLAPHIDESALAVFLVGRVIEAALRLKRHRAAETSRMVGWLSLVAQGAKVDTCLAALNGDSDEAVVQALCGILLPESMRLHRAPTPSTVPCSLLHALVLRHATKANRGIAFNADFLTSYLILLMSQARELTRLLEAKDAGIDLGASAYMEDAA